MTKKAKDLNKKEQENICFNNLCEWCPLVIHTKYRDICGRVILSRYKEFMLSYKEFIESDIKLYEKEKS